SQCVRCQLKFTLQLLRPDVSALSTNSGPVLCDSKTFSWLLVAVSAKPADDVPIGNVLVCEFRKFVKPSTTLNSSMGAKPLILINSEHVVFAVPDGTPPPFSSALHSFLSLSRDHNRYLRTSAGRHFETEQSIQAWGV